jgi:hypothetical protein
VADRLLLVTLGLQVRAAEVSVPPGDPELKWSSRG